MLFLIFMYINKNIRSTMRNCQKKIFIIKLIICTELKFCIPNFKLQIFGDIVSTVFILKDKKIRFITSVFLARAILIFFRYFTVKKYLKRRQTIPKDIKKKRKDRLQQTKLKKKKQKTYRFENRKPFKTDKMKRIQPTVKV